MNYYEAKTLMQSSRGIMVVMIDKALATGVISKRERDILYRRQIDWNSLLTVSKEFGVTRERIRQIEIRAEEKIFAEQNSKLINFEV